MNELDLLAAAVRASVALWLLGAAVAKLRNQDRTVDAFGSYGLIPRGLAELAGWLVLIAELTLGLSMLAALATPAPEFGTAALFCWFGFIQAWDLAHGRSHDCGCGAIGGGRISWRRTAVTLSASGLIAATAMSSTQSTTTVAAAALLGTSILLVAQGRSLVSLGGPHPIDSGGGA